MRIVSRGRGEEGRERMTLVPETVDDLWHLSYVLEPGDLVSGDTTRRIQRNDDQMRDTGGQREHLSVTIDVESVEFARFANRLRVGGVITGCSREDQLGQHHTLNVETHEELTIEKQFKADQLDRIEEAEQAADNPDVAIATIEEGEAYIHLVKEYGVDEYASFTKPTGKGEYSRPRAELFGELGDALSHLDTDAIILAGPGFTKQDARDYIAENHRGLEELLTMVDTSSAGGRGVHEVLKRGARSRRSKTRPASPARQRRSTNSCAGSPTARKPPTGSNKSKRPPSSELSRSCSFSTNGSVTNARATASGSWTSTRLSRASNRKAARSPSFRRISNPVSN